MQSVVSTHGEPCSAPLSAGEPSEDALCDEHATRSSDNNGRVRFMTARFPRAYAMPPRGAQRGRWTRPRAGAITLPRYPHASLDALPGGGVEEPPGAGEGAGQSDVTAGWDGGAAPMARRATTSATASSIQPGSTRCVARRRWPSRGRRPSRGCPRQSGTASGPSRSRRRGAAPSRRRPPLRTLRERA